MIRKKVFILIKNCIYCIGILLSLFSIPILIYSIKNRDKNICKYIISIDIISIVYLFVDLAIVPGILYIDTGLEILFLDFFAFISGIFYIISIVLSLFKNKKIQADNQPNPKKAILIIIILLILPIISLSTVVLKDKYLISNSDLILVYYSCGNGGFGDGETFAYAIGENFCEQFDLGIDIFGSQLKRFLPKTAIEITNINNVQGYEITLNNDSILVYKDKQCIYKKKFQSHYFNIELKECFYINHN